MGQPFAHGTSGTGGTSFTGDRTGPSIDGPGVGGAWPYVDRDATLTALLDALGPGDAGALIISGPPGVGRTRLAQEALAALRARGRRTEWATCTRTTAGMHLGALAHLVPGAAGTDDAAAAWQGLVTTLAAQEDDDRPAVLGIDDAHLLDDLSASLVHKLVLTRTASVVLTVSSTAPAPDLVDALWRDGLASRVELAPLGYEHVDELVTAALGGVLDSRTCQMLWRFSRGSAVLLHELVEAGLSTGGLRRADGIWRWHGQVTLTPRLHAVVLAETGELAPAEHTAVELLAVSGGLELTDLMDLTSAEVVGGLERRGVVVVEAQARRYVARLASPLHALLRSAELPESMADRYRRQLAGTPSVQRWAQEQPLRVAGLLLEPDCLPVPPDVLAGAAAAANAASDHELAEALARTALEDGLHVGAATALAEALRWQGRHEEAELVAAQAAPAAMNEREIQELATTRMLNLFFGLGSLERAIAVGKGSGAVAIGVPSSAVDVVATMLRLWAGDPEALTEADEEPAEEDLDPCLRLWSTLVRITTHALTGRTESALQLAGRGWAAWEECPTETESAFARTVLVHAEVLALGLGGWIREAEVRAAALHRDTLAGSGSAGDAVAALARGTAALLAGRAGEASRWTAEATARLIDSDPLGLLPLCWATAAHAAALQGQPLAARTALERAGSKAGVGAFEAQRLVSEAWTAAAEHRLADAREAAREAADAAARLGLSAIEAHALHTAVRLGDAATAAGRLRALADRVDGVMVRAYALQAEAVLADSGGALDQVAAEFESLGALAMAADAAAQAAEAHRGAGARRLASASAGRATVLARLAGGLRTPALGRLTPHALTLRERQVAALAAEGVTNLDIARRFVLSVRTVETHLAHAYDKLGINNRAGLREALAADGWAAVGLDGLAGPQLTEPVDAEVPRLRA
jgi:DNA-binding CsgD family transcriptional regulator